MAQDPLPYDKMVETALRGVARQALEVAARDGLPGDHHFYISFRTPAPGVVLPPELLAKFPEEMTIVLQHQFWSLEVGDEAFSVSLSFSGRVERLTIPFSAIVSFADPSVKFGLQFAAPAAEPAEVAAEPAPVAALPPGAVKPAASEPAERPAAEIVTLDRFRKR
ncbi:MAG TPA: ClpXP protease specificity-enhancing factor SspB [Stellaceae bacterium]|nr:ClpXP protease specificity-enhancing factor SspB [Stellaceae bacterium]